MNLEKLRSVKINGVNTLTKKNALLCSKTILESAEASGVEVLSIWVRELFPAYGLKEFCKEDWLDWTSWMKNSWRKMVLQNQFCIDEIHSWLIDFLNLLEDIQTFQPELKLENLCIIMDVMLFTLMEFSEFYRKWSVKASLEKQLKDAICLHSLILQLLNENVNKWDELTENEFFALTKVMESLCEVNKQTAIFDLKIIIETWKCISKLATYCSKCCQCFESKNPTITLKWLQTPMDVLYPEICHHIDLIYQEDTLKQPLESVDKYLRVTNFYLKLLLKLTNEFPQRCFPDAKIFFNTLVLATSMPKDFEGTPVSEIVKKYVHTNLNEIFSLIYEDVEMCQLLLSYILAHKSSEYFNLVCLYLNTIISKQNSAFIIGNMQFVSNIFEEIFKDAEVFVHSAHFVTITELFAALTILSPIWTLKKYFLRNVLKANLIIAHASTEVLLLTVYASKRSKLVDFTFLHRYLERFPLFSKNPRAHCLQRLLHHHLRHTNMEMVYENTIKCLNALKPTQVNYVYWLTIITYSKSEDKITLHDINEMLSAKLLILLEEVNTGKGSVEDYYLVLMYLNLLAVTGIEPKVNLIRKVFELLIKIYRNSQMKIERCSLLFEMSFKLAVNCKNFEYDANCVVECLLHKPCEKLYSTSLVRLLKLYSNAPGYINLQTNAKQLLTKLQLSNIPSIIRMEIEPEKYGDGKVNYDLYQRLLKNCMHEEISPRNVSSDCLHLVKRPCLEMIDNQNVKYVLKDVLDKTNRIALMRPQIDHDDVCKLKSIVKTLNSLIQK